MNAVRYQAQVLNGLLVDFYGKAALKRGQVKFQQDNAPSHTAKTTKKWFADHDIPLFLHPPSSPDLNPIEPVWHELKTLIARRPHPPTSVEELKQAVFEEWDALDISDINKHICTMPDRVRAIMDARGGNTKY